MRLLIFGPQGAGKGTQAARIAEKFGIPSIATGDIFRAAMRAHSELGKKVREKVDNGGLVPDDLTVKVVTDRLSGPDCQDGFLIDGFPRNQAQAAALDEFLQEQGLSLDAALVLEVPEEVSLRRILGRRMCSNCGRNYHVDTPPQSDWTCDVCGGQVVSRHDDLDEGTIRKRLRIYHEKTEPLKAYYESRGLLRTVAGVGTMDDVFDRIVAAL
jgi:adenylate kinase